MVRADTFDVPWLMQRGWEPEVFPCEWEDKKMVMPQDVWTVQVRGIEVRGVTIEGAVNFRAREGKSGMRRGWNEGD